MNCTRKVGIPSIMLVLFTGLAFTAQENDPAVAGKKASEWLTILRTNKETKWRRASLLALDAIGPTVRPVLPGVQNALKEDMEESIRVAAAQLLGRSVVRARDAKVDLGETVDALTTALKSDKADKVREAAARSLGEMGPDAKFSVPALAAALKDKASETRDAAAASLAKLGPDAVAALPQLTETLKDKTADRLTRASAALALSRFGAESAEKTVPVLSRVLGEPDSPTEVRKACAEGLGRLGRDAKNAVPVLAGALKDKQLDVRRAAIIALDQMGPDAKSAFAALKTASKDDDKSVRAQVVHALGNLGKEMPSEVVPLLMDTLQDTVLEVRVASALSLGVIGPDAKAAIPSLTNAARDGQAPLREAAGEALKKIQQ